MTKSNLSIAFFGTPELTKTILDEMVSAGFAPKVVVTMPDRKSGRKMLLTAPAAKDWALAHDTQVLQPEKLDEHFMAEFKKLGIDVCVVVAYGKILPTELLQIPKYGMYNVHYSLLPELRGATPVESAILLGKTETGVTVQKIATKLDTGDIIVQKKLPINKDEKTPELRKKLNEIAKKMVVETLTNIEAGTLSVNIQDENRATYCSKIKKEDGKIDLNGDDIENYNKYRAYFGWPNVYFFDVDGKRIVVKEATLIGGKFTILRVTPEGKTETNWPITLK